MLALLWGSPCRAAGKTYYDNDFPTTDVSVASGNTVTFDISNDHTYSNTISGDGRVFINGSGTFTLGGNGKLSLTKNLGISNPNLTINSNFVYNSTATSEVYIMILAGSSTTNPAQLTVQSGELRELRSYSGGSKGEFFRWGNGNYTGNILVTGGTLNIEMLMRGTEKEQKLELHGTDEMATIRCAVWGFDTAYTASNTSIYFGRGTVEITDYTGNAGINNIANAVILDGKSADSNDTTVYQTIFKVTAHNGFFIKKPMSGVGGFDKRGEYVLNLQATNTYTGPTTVSEGDLWLSAEDAIAKSEQVTNNATIAIITGAQSLNNLSGGDSGTITTLSGATLTLNNAEVGTIKDDAINTTYSGKITGAGSVTKTGAGTLTLSGANDYTGVTTISAGTLKLADAGTLGTGKISIGGNGTLEVSVSDTQPKMMNFTSTNAVSGTGRIVKSGTGTLQINAAEGSLASGSFTLSAGRLDMKGAYTGKLSLQGGTFSPGNSVGAVTITGDTELSSAVQIVLEIGGSGVDDNDSFETTGDLILTEGAKIDLVNTRDFQESETFAAKFHAGNSASFAEDFISKYVSSGYFSSLAYTYDQNGYYVITGKYGSTPPGPTSDVPEPSTWALLVLGAFGLLWVRRRK